MQALKRKKLYEGQIEKLNGTIFTLEQQKIAIEGLNTDMEVMNAMKNGANAMKQINKKMYIKKIFFLFFFDNHIPETSFFLNPKRTVDDVDQTMDDISEQMALANEIGTALQNPVGNEQFDEAELENELAELEDEQIDEAFALPKAPTSNVPVKQQKEEVNEEDEFAALEAEMN